MRVAIRKILQGGGDTPSFDLRLTSSLVPARAGNYTPTFTRSSTATVTDFEGLLKTVKSGEARFSGARRVENLVAAGHVPTTTNGWGASSGVTSVSDSDAPPGESFSAKIVNTTTNTGIYHICSAIVGNTTTLSFWAKGLLGTEVIRVYTGGLSATNVTLSASWRRYSVTSVQNDNNFFYFYANQIGTVYLAKVQGEDVTGQANQNPSEYVSSGVLPAPYHGAGVDGVKYFEYQNGNSVTANVVTENRGAAIPDATLQGYFAEGSRTNLCLRSEGQDNASWVKSNATVTANSLSSPSGATTADTLTATAANATVLQSVTSSSAAHTFSVWLKRKTGTGNIDLTLDNGATWTTKTITSSWARYDITQTLANPTVGLRIVTNGDEVYVWGAQLEQAAFASSYIATATAAVTRSGDVLSYPTAGNIGERAFSLSLTQNRLADGPINADANPAKSAINIGAYNTRSYLGFGGYDSITVQLLVKFMNTWDLNPQAFNMTLGVPNKLAISMDRDLSTFLMASDGISVKYRSNFAKTDPWANAGFWIASHSGGTTQSQNLCVKNIKIYNKALSDAKMKALTT